MSDERDRSDDWRGGYDDWKARAPDVGSWGVRGSSKCPLCGVRVLDGERKCASGHTAEDRDAAANAARGWGPGK